MQSGGGVRGGGGGRPARTPGCTRVVVGTAAVEHPELVEELCTQHPGRVAVGLDARGREVAVRGWIEGSGRTSSSWPGGSSRAGVAALVVTEIGRDGTLEGPDLDQLGAVLAARRSR